MKALGAEEEQFIVYHGKIGSKEDMFNIVNNLNTIKGTIRKSAIMSKIKELKLDPTKIDIHKFPQAIITPAITKEDMDNKSTELQRRAKINEMTLKIAKEIAQQMLDEKDELITFLVVQDRPVAVLRIPFSKTATAREKAQDIKRRIQDALEEVENCDST